MLLEADSTWCWKFDKGLGRLKLSAKGRTFYAVYSANDYLPDAFTENPFSLDDMNFMNEFAREFTDRVASLSLTLTEQLYTDLLINATAANRFHKALAAQSWFFKKQVQAYQPTLGEIIYLESDNGAEYAPFVTINSDEKTTTMLSMVVEPLEYQTRESKKMIHYCQVVKVMNDRIQCAELIKKPLSDQSLHDFIQHVI